MNHPTLSFYCPAHLYCFTAETTETLLTDVDLYDDKDRWDAAMIRNPTQYAALLDEALQQYANGILPLVDDKEYCDIISPPRSAQCALTAEGVSLWLEIKYPISHEPSPHEMLQIKKQIAASVETEIDTSQWGMIDRPEGALVVTFEPVEDWNFSTNGYQPQFTDLLEENHILTHSEWVDVNNQLCKGASNTRQLGKGYVIAVCTDSDFYIPNAEHIERNDDLIPWAVPDDIAAAQAAVQDGVCLIRGMDSVQDDVYLDTDKNRAIIEKALAQRNYKEEVKKNRARVYADMPDCVRLLSALEKELGGNSGSSADWLRTVYELNDDFEEAPADATKKLCAAFQEVKKSYGTAIASTLYNAQSIVLASELMPAAMYLHCGGDMETAKTLAASGFFMEKRDYDSMEKAVQFMADGGEADAVFAALLSNEPEPLCGISQQMG